MLFTIQHVSKIIRNMILKCVVFRQILIIMYYMTWGVVCSKTTSLHLWFITLFKNNTQHFTSKQCWCELTFISCEIKNRSLIYHWYLVFIHCRIIYSNNVKTKWWLHAGSGPPPPPQHTEGKYILYQNEHNSTP